MASVTEGQILDALRGVPAPQGGGDIVARGMVSGLVVKNGNVGFSIEVDPKEGPRMEPLRKAAEQAVEKLPGVLSVTAVLTAHRGAPGTAPQGGQAQGGQQQGGHGQAHGHQHPGGQQRSAPGRTPVAGITHIIAVASGKGGVGKSTTAVNLALALSSLGLKVGLLDADIYGPSVPRLMGISGRPDTTPEKKLNPMQRLGLKVMSMGFVVAEDTPMIWRGPMVMSAITQLLREVDWGTLDVLVCDLPPGTGDAQLTMAQSVPLSGAVIVSTPQDIALIDARKGLNMFKKVDVPVLGIVENMSYFVCPHCGGRSDIFAHGGARREAEQLGTPFLGEIPLDIAIRETSDAGTPIVAQEPLSPHTTAYKAVAEAVWRQLNDQPLRPAPRIVIQ
ncbi:MAG TPA: Mrp/NBP35 family ATP-binding protein [Candidatus Cybelea sp.]|nr:Mrp/NBP35 family ATP-binding protein [Candidatus Cybelea sp.]